MAKVHASCAILCTHDVVLLELEPNDSCLENR